MCTKQTPSTCIINFISPLSLFSFLLLFYVCQEAHYFFFSKCSSYLLFTHTGICFSYLNVQTTANISVFLIIIICRFPDKCVTSNRLPFFLLITKKPYVLRMGGRVLLRVTITMNCIFTILVLY